MSGYIPKRCRARGCGQLNGHDGAHGGGPAGVPCCTASKCRQPVGHEGAHDAPKAKRPARPHGSRARRAKVGAR